jgi:hypothetical protein
MDHEITREQRIKGDRITFLWRCACGAKGRSTRKLPPYRQAEAVNYCPQCGRYRNPVDRLVGAVCGICAKANHRAAVKE